MHIPSRRHPSISSADRQERRDRVLDALWAQVSDGKPIIGVGVGCGLTARCAERAEADLVIAYSSAPLRLAGYGSLAGLLPCANANELVFQLLPQVRRIVDHIPIMAGLFPTDLSRSSVELLETAAALGADGIQNSPTVALFDNALRSQLDEVGLGYQREVELTAAAARAGFVTAAYTCTDDDLAAMIDAGVDIAVIHLGLTAAGLVGAKAPLSLEAAVPRLQHAAQLASTGSRRVLVCCHGGPLVTREHFAWVQQQVPSLAGFFGASAFERLPLEDAVTAAVRSFKEVRLSLRQEGGA